MREGAIRFGAVAQPKKKTAAMEAGEVLKSRLAGNVLSRKQVSVTS